MDFLRLTVLSVSVLFFSMQLQAQGSSDPGVGTIGNFNAPRHDSSFTKKNEVDLMFTYGTYKTNEKYYIPQINYRLFNKKGSFLELRLPVNSAKDASLGKTVTGMGDVTATYNSRLKIKNVKIGYSFGVRVSTSNANEDNGITSASYPMNLQPSLGSTDFLIAANYDFCKFLSVAAGAQIPIIQNNKNEFPLYLDGVYNTDLQGFRRQPDAMLKLTGHYAIGKFKANLGVTSIFHLANDYYDHSVISANNYKLSGSSGTTVNGVLELNYMVSKTFGVGFTYAENIASRSNNTTDGLERTRIFSPKVTFGF